MTEPPLVFATCVSDAGVFAARLLTSPCLRRGGYPVMALMNAPSAAEALDAALAQAPAGAWVVWVHQDVHLPLGWDAQFRAGLAQAQQADPTLAVVGVYGLAGIGDATRRAGRLLDRGVPLVEATALPFAADSLDELLVAVRASSGLRFDAALRFDFYATDIALQARERGLGVAVVDSWCEHWSDTPRTGALPAAMAQRIVASGRIFETKWAHRLPVATPWLECRAAGDVERFVRSLQDPA